MYKESNYYTLFKRVRSGKVIWHYYAYDGKRRVLRSTGKSKRADALSVIGERIGTGTLIYPEGIRPQRETRGRSVPPGGSAEGADILFIDYCMSIWDYDKSDYLRRRNKEKPNSVSRKHAEEMTGALSRYVVPGVKKGLRLNEFDPSAIMRIKDRLRNIVPTCKEKGILTNAGVNAVLSHLDSTSSQGDSRQSGFPHDGDRSAYWLASG